MPMADDDPTVAQGGIPVPEPPIASDPLPGEPSVNAAPEPPTAAETEPEPERESLVDAIADLLQMFVNWLRAEASELMRDKVVLPVQQLGLTLASASAAGCLFVIGMAFIFVALLLVLAEWLGWPGALTLVGGVILAGAGTFTFIKMRSIQK